MVIDGTTTIYFLDGETEHPATLGPGQLVVVPRSTWHGFETPEAVKVLGARHNRLTTRPNTPVDISQQCVAGGRCYFSPPATRHVLGHVLRLRGLS